MQTKPLLKLFHGSLIKLSGCVKRKLASSLTTWRNTDRCKVLILSENNRISQSQIYPFFHYSEQFKQHLNVEFREINIDAFANKPNELLESADIVFIQPWFAKGESGILTLVSNIKSRNPKARIVFFDSSAPIDLRYASVVSPFVDFYVKKHVFSDRSMYDRATHGDTNLVEYYNSLYSLPAAPLVQHNIPVDFMAKLVVGPTFFTSKDMLPFLVCSTSPLSIKKSLDIHARLGTKGSSWYQNMRESALNSCANFQNSIISSELVSKRQYILELMASKVCFSPFGYGEICWRDYEAIMCGALLVKPDVAHVETQPDIFIPGETYVPVAWDFSDLSEKLTYYLNNEKERKRLVLNAYEVLHNYVNSDAFFKQLLIIFESKVN